MAQKRPKVSKSIQKDPKRNERKLTQKQNQSTMDKKLFLTFIFSWIGDFNKLRFFRYFVFELSMVSPKIRSFVVVDVVIDVVVDREKKIVAFPSPPGLEES